MAIKPWTPEDDSLISRMPAPKEDEPLFLKAVLYGPPGYGKTVTACSLGKVLLLAADPGWIAVKNHPEIDANTTTIRFEGYKQLETLSRAFYHQTPPYDQYDTFVVDTLSWIQESYVDVLVRGGKFNKDTRPTYQVTDQSLAKDLVLKEIPGRDDYHAAKNVLREPLRTLMQAPVNVVIITHERGPTEAMEKRHIYEVRPNVTEAVFNIINQDAHVIGRATKSGKQRGLDFNATPQQVAKSRIAALNDKAIKSEDFPKAIKYWQNAKWEVPSFRIEI